MTVMAITISRQVGSGGAYIGRELARRLGICYLDRQILELAAAHLDEDIGALAEREERLSGFTEKLLHSFCLAAPEAGYLPPHLPVYDRDIYLVESAIIKSFAQKESVVVVGRCGFHVLGSSPGAIHLFFHADEEFRRRRLERMYSLDPREAGEMMRETDRSRGRFVKAMTGKGWNDALNFHLCLDTGRVELPAAVDLVLQLVESVQGGEPAWKRTDP